MRTELFRAEAVAAHAEAAAGGRVLPTSRRLLAAASAGLALAIILAIAAAAIVKVDETAQGSWVTNARAMPRVEIPPGAVNRIQPGQRIRFDVNGIEGTVTGTPLAVRGQDNPLIVTVPLKVKGRLPANGHGKAVVVLARRSILGMVADAFGRGFHRG